MTAPPRIPKHYRLPPETVDQITEIADRQGGLTETRVVELAVELLHRTGDRQAARLPTAGLTPNRRPRRPGRAGQI